MKALRIAVDDLAADGPETLFDDQLANAVVALSRLQRRLDAERLAVVAEFDRRGLAADEGASSTAAWLAHRTPVTWAGARSDVGLARALARMPHTTAAFRRGDIGRWQARRLMTARGDAPEMFSRDEAVLVDAATSLGSGDFGRAVDYWRQAAAPERLEAEAAVHHERRSLHVSETFSGMVRIDGELDREGGEVVRTALRSLTEPAGRDGDARSPAQRRADALVDVCRDHLDHGDTPVAGGNRPHVTVTVDLEVLEQRSRGRCETDGGAVITGETARRLACDAAISRVVTSGASRILDVGRTTRTVPSAIRTALVVRDGGCTWDGCDRPARWCDAHHIRHWADGGTTSLDNLTLLCRHHHRLRHEAQRGPPATDVLLGRTR